MTILAFLIIGSIVFIPPFVWFVRRKRSIDLIKELARSFTWMVWIIAPATVIIIWALETVIESFK